MRRHVPQAVLVAFALLVGTHLGVLARLAMDAEPSSMLLVLLAAVALLGLSALALAWGGLIRGNDPALIGALAALALYSMATLVVVTFPNSDSAAPDDDPTLRVLSYLALLWTLALAGLATRQRQPAQVASTKPLRAERTASGRERGSTRPSRSD